MAVFALETLESARGRSVSPSRECDVRGGSECTVSLAVSGMEAILGDRDDDGAGEMPRCCPGRGESCCGSLYQSGCIESRRLPPTQGITYLAPVRSKRIPEASLRSLVRRHDGTDTRSDLTRMMIETRALTRYSSPVSRSRGRSSFMISTQPPFVTWRVQYKNQ